jgi:hypothetical protein
MRLVDSLGSFGMIYCFIYLYFSSKSNFIVKYIDKISSEEEGIICLVMEYINGEA